jgi:hypothetical protein
MKSSLRKKSQLVLLVATLGVAGDATAAPIDSPNAACRRAVAGAVNKLGSTAMKAFEGCVKLGLKDDAGDCSTLALADLKNKVPTATSRLVAKISSTCDDATHATALAEHLRCGVPVGTSVASFADLSTCLSNLVTTNVEDLFTRLLDADFAAATIDSDRCIRTLASSANRLFRAVQKGKAKGIGDSDKIGGDSSYVDPGDPNDKINRTRTRAEVKILSACSPLPESDWAAIGTCGNDSTAAVACVLDDVEAVAGGLTASAYDQPGGCPGALRVTFRGGAQGGATVTATDLDYGTHGFTNDNDFTDGASLQLDVSCGAPTNNTCSACTVASSCEGDNCRCEHDNSLVCDEPFGPDADDCGGNDCEMFFGPPLPVPASGIPVCLLNNVDQAMTGTADFSSGEISLDLDLRTFVHLGEAQNRQCPFCESGVCNGGERNGLACDVDASSDFGDVSYDCPPTEVSNLSGLGGIQYALTLGTSLSTLPLDVPCDPPLEAFDCACSVCTGDLTLACNSDLECSDVGAGTCMTSGLHGGADRVPNLCNDLTCTPTGGDQGQCNGGPSWAYCDGYLKGNGDGVLTCATNGDCAPGFVGFDAGFCTLLQPLSCFPDAIDAFGAPARGSPTLASTFCRPPTTSPFTNGIFRLPGPARMTLATHVSGICSDGVTPWGVGGANCP